MYTWRILSIFNTMKHILYTDNQKELICLISDDQQLSKFKSLTVYIIIILICRIVVLN